MFILNDDLSIYATRGDIVFFTVTAEYNGGPHVFKAGDVVRIKIYGKKNANELLLQKDFPVARDCESVDILLSKEDTQIGDIISKPKDYWYEVVVNDDTKPQTIIGYDDDGAKVFKLFPEGKDLEQYIPDAEDIPFVDTELDLLSPRPVQNQAIARAIVSLQAEFDETKEDVAEKTEDVAAAVTELQKDLLVERNRINALVALPEGSTTNDARLEDICVGADGVTYDAPGDAVRDNARKLLGMTLVDIEWIDGQYIDNNQYNGYVATSASYECTDYIEMPPLGFALRYNVTIGAGPIIARFDKQKRLIDFVSVDAKSELTGELTNADGCCYVRLSNMKGEKASVWVSAMAAAEPANESIKKEMIADNAVTADKASFLHHAPWTNHLKEDFWIANCYVDGSNAGVYKKGSGLWATKLVPLEAGASYEFEGLYHGYYAFYDASGAFVSGNDAGKLTSPFTVPEGAVYGAFTANSEENKTAAWIGSSLEYAYIADKNVYATPMPAEYSEEKPCDYGGNDIGVFAHGLCVGDSLTQGGFNCTVEGCAASHSLDYPQYSYPSKLEMISGIPMTNMGYSGYTAAQWYEKYKDVDLSGHDFAIIHLGVNDAYQNGGWKEESKTAFANIISKLAAENKGIKIFVSTIAPMKSYQSAAIKEVSQGIRALIFEMSEENVILVDMAEHGHTNESMAYNCGHLSAYGYWRLAKDFNNYISWYINRNKMQFRSVQFIGSGCEYVD